MAQTIDGLLDMGTITVGSISIDPGDFRIGAVEIQDETTGARANVTDGSLEVYEQAANSPFDNSVAAGPVAALLLAANATRKVAVFTNTSIVFGETVYLGGPTVAVGQGIQLAPGETYEDTETNHNWWVIAAAGTPSISVHESYKV